MLQQPVVEPARRGLIVAAPVTNEDTSGHNVLGGCSIAPHGARESGMETIRAHQRRIGDLLR
jgi:hypothetical protein